jgi:hypothetical protein
MPSLERRKNVANMSWSRPGFAGADDHVFAGDVEM